MLLTTLTEVGAEEEEEVVFLFPPFCTVGRYDDLFLFLRYSTKKTTPTVTPAAMASRMMTPMRAPAMVPALLEPPGTLSITSHVAPLLPARHEHWFRLLQT